MFGTAFEDVETYQGAIPGDDYLSSFLAKPHVIVVVARHGEEVIGGLVAYELDVALVEGPVADDRLSVEPWREDELVLIAPRAHRLAGRQTGWREVRREVLLVREPGSGTRDVVAQGLAAAGLAPDRTMELGSTEAIKQAVAAGLGLAFVSRAAASDQLAIGAIATVRVRGLHLSRTLTRLTLRGRAASATVAAFGKVLEGSRRYHRQ